MTLLEVGRITKPHGVRGDVIVVLSTDRLERVAPGAVLESSGRTFEVVRSSPHQNGHIVHFRGVDDRNAAEALRGVVLKAAPIDDPDALWVHDLIGAVVVDRGIERGRVTAVQDNPASDLLVLDSGALVPVRFVVSHVPGERVEVDAPEGLFDLDEA